MFYFAKILQALGLTIILIDFLRNFPELMSRTILVISIGLFTSGWILNRFFVKQ